MFEIEREFDEIGELESEMEKEVVEIEACPECGSPRLILDYRKGELLCQDCGLVIEESYIDEGPEWRSFESEQRKRRVRVGAPVTYAIHDKGLTTIIGEDRDFYGKPISGVSRAWFFRLRKWQKRIRISNAAERNLAFALGELDRMVAALGLPKSLKEEAAIIYRKALSKNLIKGRSIEGIAAAALYAACRGAKIPRTLNEIAAFSKIERKELGRMYRYMVKKLGLKLMPVNPLDFIARFCSALKLDGETQEKAMEIIKKAEENELLSGRSPLGVAAAAIYIASILNRERKERRTQKEIAQLAGVTEVTLRNRYKELCNKLEIRLVV